MAKAKSRKEQSHPSEERMLIGKVGVDSGQLMICDPCYIDSEWQSEEFTDQMDKYFIFPDGKEEKVKHCSERWFELIGRVNSGELRIEDRPNPDKLAQSNFSYNAICQKTIADAFAQLHYKHGHAGVGVAFNSGFGDGYYEVYATFRDMGDWGRRITKVEIVMIDEDELEQIDED